MSKFLMSFFVLGLLVVAPIQASAHCALYPEKQSYEFYAAYWNAGYVVMNEVNKLNAWCASMGGKDSSYSLGSYGTSYYIAYRIDYTCKIEKCSYLPPPEGQPMGSGRATICVFIGGNPIEGVSIAGDLMTTEGNGCASIQYQFGSYPVLLSHPAYGSAEVTVDHFRDGGVYEFRF